MSDIGVRTATTADASAVDAMLARAFDHDPMTRSLLPSGARVPRLAEAEWVPAHLQSSGERNVGLDARFGFERTDTLMLACGGAAVSPTRYEPGGPL